jgi:sortase A
MWNVPNRFAAGWLNTSAPAGERGNTVLDGHHNIAGEVFRYVVDLKRGDTIQLWVGNQPREYVVSLRKILPEKGQPLEVRLDNAKWIQPTSDERLTLVTCWPYTNNTHRLIVVALPADALPRDNGVQ